MKELQLATHSFLSQITSYIKARELIALEALELDSSRMSISSVIHVRERFVES